MVSQHNQVENSMENFTLNPFLAVGEISSDLYHALQCDIEISKVKSFELEKKWWKSS